jgi:hypothetical protein
MRIYQPLRSIRVIGKTVLGVSDAAPSRSQHGYDAEPTDTDVVSQSSTRGIEKAPAAEELNNQPRAGDEQKEGLWNDRPS